MSPMCVTIHNTETSVQYNCLILLVGSSPTLPLSVSLAQMVEQSVFRPMWVQVPSCQSVCRVAGDRLISDTRQVAGSSPAGDAAMLDIG